MALMQRDRTMSDTATPSLNRRRLIELVGASVGGAAAYQVMTRLGFASESKVIAIRQDGDGVAVAPFHPRDYVAVVPRIAFSRSSRARGKVIR
jgi:hypothetical protein